VELSGLDVWRVDLRRPPEWVAEAARTILTQEEASRRGREPDEVRRRRLVARTALRIALARRLEREPHTLRFGAGPDGKPRLAGEEASGPGFNLSHSGELCVIAICEDASVGVDVEAVRERPHLRRLAETRLAPAEAQEILLLEGEERRRAFYRAWTRKEAYLKACGLGLRAELSSFVVSTGARPALLAPLPGDEGVWSLYDLEVGEDFQGALALGAPGHDAEGSIKTPELPINSLSEWRHSQ
jgi:4'-phosphopantetheinyl transferase